MANDPDIVILGAGAAGLAAAVDLTRAGMSVSILEARDRIGGRMFTQRDPASSFAIELGAEFIHGLPPEIWQLLQEHKVRVTEVSGDDWCVRDGKLCRCDFFSEVDQILNKMEDRQPDESFLQFLERAFPDSKSGAQRKQAKQWAIGYVTGFNAADPGEVSVRWLLHEMRADERIEGERAFRAVEGYTSLLEIFHKQLQNAGVPVELSTSAHHIRWQRGAVEIAARQGSRQLTFRAPRALVTLPLGVLQARPGEDGALEFLPELPREKQTALAKLAMGKVIRVTLCFRQRFWDKIQPIQNGEPKTLSDLSFLFSRDPSFPTWWTTMPDKLPVITGWAPAAAAERMSGLSQSAVVEAALDTLGRLLGVEKHELSGELEASYFHDWQNDPYSRGAYSYAKVGGAEAPGALSAPVEGSLFFAGEATDVSGHNGTVHGAIASGRRAAAEIITSLSLNLDSNQASGWGPAPPGDC